MSTFAEMLYEPEVQQWAMALIHFLWQGCIVVAITSTLLRRMDGSAPTTRYGTCLVALVLLSAAPPITFLVIGPSQPVQVAESSPRDSMSDRIEIDPHAEMFGPTLNPEPFEAAPPTVFLSLLRSPWETARTALVAVWFVGELILGIWLVGGMLSIHIACRRARPAPQEVSTVTVRLSSAIGLSKVPPVFCTDYDRDAASMGFLKPWILVPSAWLTQMTPEMIEAVLAHELMHIRRHDLWVNLFQRLAELILFFHPAVWWLSRRVREERELCCDTAAVRITGKRKTYAQMLAYAAEQRMAESLFRLATNLGDDRMSLLNRVQWVLREQRSAARPDCRPAVMVAMLVAIVMIFGIPNVRSIAEEESSAAPVVIAGQTSPTAVGQEGRIPPTPIGELPLAENVARRTRQQSLQPGPAPSESNKVTLLDYVIEPPDVLLIEAVRLVPKAPHEIRPQDVMSIVVHGTTSDRPIVGQFLVEPSGVVNLGPGYGNVKVSGLTTTEAANEIRTLLLRELNSPEVAVSMFQPSSPKVVTGEHLVAPDGTVNLGVYGRVYVAGMTIDEGRAAIENQLEESFQSPKVTMEVFVYNSKFFYIINEGASNGRVTRIPVTGNETVLDAIALIGGLERSSEKRLWISRPALPGAAEDKVLPIDWAAITQGAETSTNYQLLPGDRLFISEPQETEDVAARAANTHQVEVQLNRYNRLIRERRIDEAIALAQAIKKDLPGTEIARLVEHHSQLLQALEAQRKSLDEWLGHLKL